MKKYSLLSILLSISFVSFLSSCTKETLPALKRVYAMVKVEVAALPGTPELELRFNEEKISDLPMGNNYTLAANHAGILAVYDRSTGTLVADTTITLAKGESKVFKVAYSNELGLKGWISGKLVPADSLALQFQNKLSADNYPVSQVDLYICAMNPLTGDISDPIAILEHFDRGTLHPATVTLPVADADSAPIWYLGKLKDRTTGEFITNMGLGADIFILAMGDDSYRGTYGIYVVKDDLAGAIETTAVIL